ncbi:solute carrier family 2, facilitated glucose transporter member 8-like [Penaeus japonicus]|uniref:solute carrier family 2, facilitated glucose transporter member 8-like n=1 Tax=Penaeus japonicus TaxID=27405 RepID=UPI001C71741A|nr:solute carrier family 2, facilitated glucose transporter member 8-like [Penaeus japonicus]
MENEMEMVEENPMSDSDEREAERPEEEPRAERRRRLLRQFGLVCLATSGHFSLGATLPWPSPALSSMAENNATLVGTEIVLTSAEMDMTGSLVSLGSLVGAWVAGWMVSVLGRRRSLQVISVPYLLGWLCNALSPNAPVLLTARFVLGLACGATTVAASSYIMELADVSVRGMMSTMPTLGIVVGSLYTVWMGYVFPWHYLALVCAVPPALLLVVTFFLPHSPSFLVVRGRRQTAIAILKGLRGDYADVEAEVLELERRNASSKASAGWKSLFQPDVVKRISVVVALFLFQQMCGNYVFMIQTARILEAAGAPWDPDAATVVVAGVRVAGTVVTFFLLDRVGRRHCLTVSHAINAFALVVLGVYVHLRENAALDDDTYIRMNWLPLLCVLVIMFIMNVGLHPVPFILATEYFPTNIRAQASSICFSSGTAFAFLALQLYTPMQATLTQAGLYWFYAAVSALGVVVSVAFVHETKGRAVG